MKMTKHLIILMSLVTVGAMARPQQGGGNRGGQSGGDRGEQGGREGGSQQSGGFVERLDRDSDGKISADEFDGPAEHFSRFDRNGDGYISEDEAPTGPPPGREQQERPPKGDQESEPQGGEQGSRPEGAGFIDRLDQDGDGKVSASEFDGPADAFEEFDRNGDGYISDKEAPKGPPPSNRE